MDFKIIAIPIISGLIGWFTNWVAVKMLFHPKDPINVLGMTIQGIFPKRQKQFAQKLGQVIANELININDITKAIQNPSQFDAIKPLIEEHIDTYMTTKLPQQMPFISMFATDELIGSIKQSLMNEIELLFPKLIGGFANQLQKDINIEQLVVDKVTNFSSDKLEQMLLSIMKREFKFVEWLGGIIGFIIGIVQVLMLQL